MLLLLAQGTKFDAKVVYMNLLFGCLSDPTETRALTRNFRKRFHATIGDHDVRVIVGGVLQERK